MAVRQLAVGDNIVRSIGALSSMTYGTIAVIFKLVDQDELYVVLALLDSADDGGITLLSDVGGGDQSMLLETQGGDFAAESGAELDSGIWYLVVVRKDTGTVIPRFSFYDFSTDLWAHSDGDAIPDGQSLSGGSVQFALPNAFGGSGIFYKGLVAIQAVWLDSLPWSADSTGDTNIENAGLEIAASNWIDESPDSMWRFNQTSTSTDVTDDTGNGADQTSITGTTVITNDDPPGFNFSLSSAQDIFPVVLSASSLLSPGVQVELVPVSLSPITLPGPSVFIQQNADPFPLAPFSLLSPSVQNTVSPSVLEPISLISPSVDIDGAVNPSTLNSVSLLSPNVILAVDFMNPVTLEPLVLLPVFVTIGQFEPIYVGDGTVHDQIMLGLATLGFDDDNDTISDRERQRLLAKLGKQDTDTGTIYDLYDEAQEPIRLPWGGPNT